MRWKISIEGSDEITRGQRCEFEIEKNFEDLTDGSVGLSIEDGKTILASLQRFLVEQQCALYVLFRRHCQGCGGIRPIKDYSTRTIQTVYGAVTLQSPRLYACRRCVPGVDCRVAVKSVLLRFRCKFCAVEGLSATRHFAGWKSFQAVRQPQE